MTRASRSLRALGLGVACTLAGPAFADPAKDIALEIKRLGQEIREIRATPSLDQDTLLGEKIAFASVRQRFFLVYAVLRSQWGVVTTPAEVAAATEPDLAAVELARTDVQAGANASSSGSSSLISKGSGPSYFSAAIENGGLLKSVSDATTTFQGNVIGIFDAVGGAGYMAGYNDDSKITRFLRRFSFAFTLKNGGADVADAISTPDQDSLSGQIDALNRRLEQYSVRSIVGRNRRDPRDEGNATALRKMMDNQGQAVLAALDEALEDLQTSPSYDQWITESVKALKAVPLGFLEGVLIQRLNLLADLAQREVTTFPATALSALGAYSAFASARDKVLETVEARKLFAVEYVNSREAAETERSTFRFISEGQKGRWDLTFNAAYTAYHDSIDGAGFAFRDFQLGGEAARPLGNRHLRGQPDGPAGNPVLSFGFLYERLAEAATVSFAGNTLSAPPGNIYIGQARVTIPVGKSGVKVPLSLSFANRTELLAEKEVRGHIGFTFNFDAVASMVRK